MGLSCPRRVPCSDLDEDSVFSNGLLSGTRWAGLEIKNSHVRAFLAFSLLRGWYGCALQGDDSVPSVSPAGDNSCDFLPSGDSTDMDIDIELFIFA
jgi:hypothetical protein